MKPELRRALLAELLGDLCETDTSEPTTEGSATKIVVLQRGWVVVGRVVRSGDYITVTDAATIRVWGTARGLGEIATGGPTSKTVLDPCPDVRAHVLTVVLTIDCVDSKWAR